MDTPLLLKVTSGDAVPYEKDQIGKVLAYENTVPRLDF